MNEKHEGGKVAFSPEGAINFRDLGGYETSDGRIVRRGMLFRSGELAGLTNRGRALLKSIPVGTILDYRDADEAERTPDPTWEGLTVLIEPASSDILRARGLSADIRQMIRSMPTDFDGANLMRELYRELPFNNRAWRRLFELLSDSGRHGLLQHCTAGKDRTGVGSALTLLALGVPVDTVRRDYMLTGEYLGEAFAREMLRRMADDALPPETFRAVLPLAEARREYIDTALSAILDRYGGFDSFFEREYGLDAGKREALHAIYLE